MIKGGPKIINDGLVLCLDAHDAKSYAGEPTTNLISNGDFENNTTSGWSFDPKTNGSFSVTSDDKKSGLYSAKLTNSTSSAIALWKSISITSGQQYTMSAWIKNINCPTTPYFSISSGGSFNDTSSGSSTTGVTAGSDWVYVSKTFTATNTQTTNPYIRTNSNASQGYFLVDDFQIENKTYSTPFINGSRSATNGWLDLSGNGNNGTLTNMVGTGVSHYRDGQVIKPINNAYLDFDGSNDYVVTSSNYSLSGSQTFEVWFMIEGGPSSPAGLLTQHDHAVPANFGINHVSGNKLAPSIGYTDNTREYSSKTTVTTFSHDTLYHAALVYDSSANKVIWYVNGVYDNQYTLSKTPQFAAKPFQLGRWSYNYNNYYYNGRVYKASVYSNALTAAEVLSNYNATKGRF